jgi:hypothetical protein
LRLAGEASDHALGGEILAGMSHQAVYIGQPDDALDLARAAQTSAHKAGLPALLTESLVMEAHAHAAKQGRRRVRQRFEHRRENLRQIQ